MNQKTDTSPEFSSDFITVLVALTGATLLFILLSEKYFYDPNFLRHFRFAPFPWVNAGGITISNGLCEYSGEPLVSPSRLFLVAILFDIIISFVLGPTLFFFGWRQRQLEKASGENPQALRGSTVMAILGGILIFNIAVPSIPASYIQRQVAGYLRNAQAIQSDKDSAMNELNAIAFSAIEYHHLPKSLGGGAGHFTGYDIPGSFRSTNVGKYEIVSVSEEALQLKATSAHYPGSSILVTLDGTGNLGSWQYSGEFE